MRVLHEREMSPSEIKRDLEAIANKKAKEKEKKKKRKSSKSYRKYQERVQKYKEDRQKWLEQQAAENKKRREEAAGASTGGETISEKDPAGTATAKGISNVASVVGRLAKLGGKALANRMRQKAKAREAGEEKAGEKAAETKAKMKQKLLPPGRSGPNEITDKTSRQQPGTSRPQPPNPNFRQTGQSIRNRARQFNPNIPRLPSASSPTSTDSSSRSPHPFSYTNPQRVKKVKVRVLDSPKLLPPAKSTNEEFSCWREEFLYELGELRQKTKSKITDKEPIIDIMKGKNKITMNPNVSESAETPQGQFDRRVAAAKLLKDQAKIKMLKYAASKHPKVNEELTTADYMAKATPKITGRIKPISDIHLSKQPGKGTAEMVRDRMKKLFMNEPVDLSPFDFNKESYDDETFRHHSSGRTTNVSNSDSGDNTRKRRISAALAALNKDVEPKAKKKKKKEQ